MAKCYFFKMFLHLMFRLCFLPFAGGWRSTEHQSLKRRKTYKTPYGSTNEKGLKLKETGSPKR